MFYLYYGYDNYKKTLKFSRLVVGSKQAVESVDHKKGSHSKYAALFCLLGHIIWNRQCTAQDQGIASSSASIGILMF